MGNSPNTGQVFRRCKVATASPARSTPILCQGCYREWWDNDPGQWRERTGHRDGKTSKAIPEERNTSFWWQGARTETAGDNSQSISACVFRYNCFLVLVLLFVRLGWTHRPSEVLIPTKAAGWKMFVHHTMVCEPRRHTEACNLVISVTSKNTFFLPSQ